MAYTDYSFNHAIMMILQYVRARAPHAAFLLLCLLVGFGQAMLFVLSSAVAGFVLFWAYALIVEMPAAWLNHWGFWISLGAPVVFLFRFVLPSLVRDFQKWKQTQIIH